MSLILIAVAIVVAAIVLIMACAISMSVEKPLTKTVSVERWCPVAARQMRVGVAKSVDRRLDVVSCDRFPDGVIQCDRACIPVSFAA